MSEINLELSPWLTPNFVSAKMPPRPRQEGLVEGLKLALSDVDASVLSDMCDDFRAEIFRKAGKSDPKEPQR